MTNEYGTNYELSECHIHAQTRVSYSLFSHTKIIVIKFLLKTLVENKKQT